MASLHPLCKTENIENDLKLIHEWSIKQKMVFNPDTTKPAEELLFTNNTLNNYRPTVYDGLAIKPVDDYKHIV